MIALPQQDLEVYQQIREMAQEFSDHYIKPIAGDLDQQERFPSDLYRQMGAQGLFGITVPADIGGAGLDVYAYALVMEELARGYASVADQCGLIELIGTLLSQYGTKEQQSGYLPGVLSNDLKVAYCITEPDAGSDVSGLRTTAVKNSDGWRLSGNKQWIHNAPVADIGFVLARTDPEAGHRGMSIFIVDLNAEGVTRGPRDHKMGQRASQVGPLFFEDVQVPNGALLGELNKGFYIMMSVLEKGRIGIAALAVGIAQAGLEAALEYVQVRRQFGKAIVENQGLQWILADMATDITAARSLIHNAAITKDRGANANMLSSMAKKYASDMAVKRTADAVQVFGGSGYIRGFEVERLYRDAKITQIYEGTNQIQQTIIAKELLKGSARK